MGRKSKEQSEKEKKEYKGLKVDLIAWSLFLVAMFAGTLLLPFAALRTAKDGDVIGTYYTYALFGLTLFGLAFSFIQLMGLAVKMNKIGGDKNGA